MENLDNEIKELEKQLVRAKELRQYLDRDLPQSAIDEALVWYYHTDLTPAQIFQKIC